MNRHDRCYALLLALTLLPLIAFAQDEPGGGFASVSTKFDFVPGDKVLFIDDFTQDELGEFPARGSSCEGTFEIAEMDGERWLRCTSDDGTVRMKLPRPWSRSPSSGRSSSTSTRRSPWPRRSPCADVDASGQIRVGSVVPAGQRPRVPVRRDLLDDDAGKRARPAGRHHVMFMARGPALKVYIDRQRMVNVPDITAPEPAQPSSRSDLWATTEPDDHERPLRRGQCRPAKDLLAEGKLVTHGIHFDRLGRRAAGVGAGAAPGRRLPGGEPGCEAPDHRSHGQRRHGG